MTFTPKAWTNGTLVDAAAMIDLETRLGAYSDSAPSVASNRRYQALISAQGYYAETFQRIANPAVTAVVSGTIYYVGIGLLAGDVVTNIHTRVSTAGASFTGVGVKVGIYDKAGNRLAVSGDVSAAHTTTGAKANALSSPYTILTTDQYFLSWICITASTLPAMPRGGTSNPVYDGAFTGGVGPYFIQAGQTDLPTTATIVYNSGASIAYWLGVS